MTQGNEPLSGKVALFLSVMFNLVGMEANNALKVRDIIRLLENWAPPVLQENYDNSGLIVGDRDV